MTKCRVLREKDGRGAAAPRLFHTSAQLNGHATHHLDTIDHPGPGQFRAVKLLGQLNLIAATYFANILQHFGTP